MAVRKSVAENAETLETSEDTETTSAADTQPGEPVVNDDKNVVVGDATVDATDQGDLATTQLTDNADKPETAKGDDAMTDPAFKPIGGDGVTGVSNDGATYIAPDHATGANTNDGVPNTMEGDTPVDTGEGVRSSQIEAVPGVDRFESANAMVSVHAPPAEVDAETVKVIETFRRSDKAVTGMQNLFDDLGLQRAELPQLAKALNDKLGIALTVGEAQNFLLVRDVTNSVKRKVTVAARVG